MAPKRGTAACVLRTLFRVELGLRPVRRRDGACHRLPPGSLIAFNLFLKRQRRRLLTAVAGAVLASGVAAAHGAPGGDHMNGHMDGGAGGKALAMCLAVAETAALGLAAGAVLSFAWRRHRHPLVSLGRPVVVSHAGLVPVPAARAGPARLQVFRL